MIASSSPPLLLAGILVFFLSVHACSGAAYRLAGGSENIESDAAARAPAEWPETPPRTSSGDGWAMRAAAPASTPATYSVSSWSWRHPSPAVDEEEKEKEEEEQWLGSDYDDPSTHPPSSN